jgi:hypothetical protein
MKENYQIIHYQTIDGKTAISVNMLEDTVWLSQKQIATLFERDYKTISKHILNVFGEGALDKNATVAKFATVVAKFATTVADGKTYQMRILG